MENIFLRSTPTTPEVSFKTDGVLSIFGISIPENAPRFYEPLSDWLKKFEPAAALPVLLKLDIDYVNTASYRTLIELIQLVIQKKQHGNPVTIEWYYVSADEDLLELGENFQQSLNFKLTFIAK